MIKHLAEINLLRLLNVECCEKCILYYIYVFYVERNVNNVNKYSVETGSTIELIMLRKNNILTLIFPIIFH
jgi:argonaute-like protein implicated in RNA metabolism and viral defense